MKKLLLPLLSILLLTACQKQIPTDNAQKEIAGTSVKRTSPKINVCHYDRETREWEMISINLTAWPDHQADGDVRLDDQDGDGFVPNNACGYGTQGDFDDNNAAIHPSIGDSYQGGIIAYILQPGDPGYSATAAHGLIAAPSDQSTGADWGCLGTQFGSFDDTRSIGTGNQNTINILAGCAEAGIAARLCGDLVLNGYSDWYLPSLDELNKLYINQVAIGGFENQGGYPFIDRYWSSTEDTGLNAWCQFFSSGNQHPDEKDEQLHVRAVRSF